MSVNYTLQQVYSYSLKQTENLPDLLSSQLHLSDPKKQSKNFFMTVLQLLYYLHFHYIMEPLQKHLHCSVILCLCINNSYTVGAPLHTIEPGNPMGPGDPKAPFSPVRPSKPYRIGRNEEIKLSTAKIKKIDGTI